LLIKKVNEIEPFSYQHVGSAGCDLPGGKGRPRQHPAWLNRPVWVVPRRYLQKRQHFQHNVMSFNTQSQSNCQDRLGTQTSVVATKGELSKYITHREGDRILWEKDTLCEKTASLI
jgi:hypothetical protein